MAWTIWYPNMNILFSIYIGQPVSPQFGQMARKIQDW